MCKISLETINRANEQMIARGTKRKNRRQITHGEFFVSVTYNGKTFSQTITEKESREAYKAALQTYHAKTI